VADEQRYIGNIYLSGEQLQLSFAYSKVRFAAIKNIKGAAYNKELKRWCLPVTSLPNLLSSKLFSEKFFRYTFDKQLAQERLIKINENIKSANAVIEQNPFEVDEEYIEHANIDCVIRDSSESLRVFIKKRSKAKKIIENLPGSFFIKAEGGYFLPTISIKHFICELRDHKISFAVTKKTGGRLKQTASFRHQIFNHGGNLCAEELRQAMLVPYMSINSYGGASIYYATPEQLQELIPEVRGGAARIKFAATLNIERIVMLLLASEQSKVKLWYSKEILDVLSDGGGLDYFYSQDACQFLPVLFNLLNGKNEAVWIKDYSGGGLLIDDLTEIEVPNGALTVHPQFPALYFIKPNEKELPDFFNQVTEKLGQIQQSPAFKDYYEVLLKRLVLRKRCQQFNQMKDCDPKLQNNILQNDLFPHQRVAVKWLLESAQAFLGDDMGLGKTLSILAAFQELQARSNVSFLLVIAPNSLVLNWFREAKRWIGDLRFVVLPEAVKAKQACIKELRTGDYYHGLIINYEKVRLEYICPAIQELCSKRSVMLCLDESQRVKNPLSKVCKALSYIAPLCKRRVLLSGTPTPRDLADIWSQMLLLDGGERFGTNYYTWLTKVAEIGNQWSAYAVRRFLPEKVDETISRVQEVLLRRRKNDVIDLPEKLFSVRDLELSGEQAQRYDEVRKELLLKVKDIDGNTSVKQIESILEEYLRAVQLASNPRIVDPTWKGEPVKFLELDEIVDEVVEGQAGKLVIWTNFRHNVSELVERYAHYGAKPYMGDIPTKERDKIVKDFQNVTSSFKILVAIPAAGGVGITLTAAQTAVYLEKTWNAEHWQQSVDRIHRIGQTGTVTIISLQACPVDELIAANLAKKVKAQAKLLGDIKTKGSVAHEIAEADLLPSKEELLLAVSKASKK